MAMDTSKVVSAEPNQVACNQAHCHDCRLRSCDASIRSLLAKGRNVLRFRRNHTDELPPPGNLSSRFPYETFRRYYYDRPYNVGQIRIESDSTRKNRALPYSNQIFRDVFLQFDERILEKLAEDVESPTLTSGDHSILHDKSLEYVDWREYRRARLKWLDQKRNESAEELPSPHRMN